MMGLIRVLDRDQSPPPSVGHRAGHH
jgi:hypothetical protein